MEADECICELCGKDHEEVTEMVICTQATVCMPCIQRILSKIDASHTTDSQEDLVVRHLAAQLRSALELAGWCPGCSTPRMPM